MNNQSLSFSILLFLVLGLMSACQETCDPNVNAEVGEEFFTVTYQDASGNNLLDSFNPDQIVVFWDSTGGEDPTPDFQLISPGYADGKFGPFFFTEGFTDAATNNVNLPVLFGQNQAYDYYIRTGNNSVDTFRVEFLLGVDECNYFWESINYFLNGDPISVGDPRQADIVVTP